MDAIVEALCEALAHGATALRSLVESRVHDARADAHVDQIDRLAARMAAEATVLGDTVTFRRALRIRQHCVGYRRADNDGEDRHVEAARTAVEKLCSIVRGVNRSLTRELAKRGGSRR